MAKILKGGEYRGEKRVFRRSVLFYGAVALSAGLFTTGAAGGVSCTVNHANTGSTSGANSNTADGSGYSYSSSESFSFHGTLGNPDGHETFPPVPQCTDPAPAMPGLNTYSHNGLGVPKIPPGVLEQLVCHQVEAKWPGDNAAWPLAFYIYYRETGWDNSEGDNVNGPCTFAQFDPCTKLDGNYDPATDIKKALGYIDDRYQTPEAAWDHELNNDWY